MMIYFYKLGFLIHVYNNEKKEEEETFVKKKKITKVFQASYIA